MTEDQEGGKLNKSIAKPLATTAGILGLIQGIAWTVFSVLCICCYCGVITVDPVDVSNKTAYYNLIYCIFLDNGYDSCQFNSSFLDDVLIKPKDVLIFLCFYTVFSVVWLGTSATIVWAMIHNQWQMAKCLFATWSTTTICISIVDVVLTSLVAGDYITHNGNGELETQILVTYGIVMSLAARGYVLWVVNIIFAAIMMKYTIDTIIEGNNDSRMPIIHGYESNDTNPPWFNGSVKDFWATTPPVTRNSNVYENAAFQRSQSFFNIEQPPSENIYAPPPGNYNRNSTNTGLPNHNYNQNSTNMGNNYHNMNSINNQNTNTPNRKDNQSSFSEAIRTATIGRNKGRSRSPLTNVPPPFIPEPDYTPPTSPNTLKSVLRTKSNYN